MSQTTAPPAGPVAENGDCRIPQSLSGARSADALPSASVNVARILEVGSLIDMCQVAAFLIVAIAARSVLTEGDPTHVEGVSDPEVRVPIPEASSDLDLTGFSTAGF